MKNIKYAMIELKGVSNRINFFNGLLDGILILLVFFAIFKIFSFKLYYAVIPAIIFMFGSLYYRNTRNIMRDIEKKVPSLNEELRTAADNINEENEVVNSLNRDVLRKMKGIRSSHFLSYQNLFKKIVMMSLLSFIVIIVASVNVRIDVPDLGDIGLSSGIVGRTLAGDVEEEEGNRELYGDESFIMLGNEELMIEIEPLLSEIDLSDVSRNFEEQEFETNMFPTDIHAVGEASYKEKNINKEDSEIVKEYYKKINL